MPDFQLILLPRRDYFQWVFAAKDYVIKFAANLTAEPGSAGRYLAEQLTVTVVDVPDGYPEHGDIQAWFARNFPTVRVDAVPAQTPADLREALARRIDANDRFLPLRPGFDFSRVWPAGKCLVGLHGRADGRLQAADLAVVAQARVEAVKLMSTAATEDAERLWAINPKMYLMVRLFDDLRERQVNADDFASHVIDDMRRFYQLGVRDFEVHNEPNLRDEGWGVNWPTGREFAGWFLRVRANLAYSFPEARFGWPGLSPDGLPMPNRTNDMRFLDEAEEALRAADFIGIHCYWRDEAERLLPSGGLGWREYRRRYPEKLLFITEFSNPAAGVDPRLKGEQYVRYYQDLRSEPGMGAAFSFVASASAGFGHEAWRGEDGRLSAIVSVVGARSLA
jgi:hypothetical protein